MNEQPGYERNLPEEMRRPAAGVFDALVQSNLKLTEGVGKLVRVTYGVLAFNALLVVLVILAVWGHR